MSSLKIDSDINFSPINSLSPRHESNDSLNSGSIKFDEDEINDSQFKNNIREVLLTQKQHNESKNLSFQQPLKGSFLAEMQNFGKSLSFESDVFDIFQGSQQTEFQNYILASVMKQKLKIENSSFQNPFKRELSKKYIIDFSKKDKKEAKNRNSCRKVSQKPLYSQKDGSLTFINSKNSTIGSRIEKKSSSKKKKKTIEKQKSVKSSLSQWSSIQTPLFMKKITEKYANEPKKAKKKESKMFIRGEKLKNCKKEEK